MPDTHYTVAKPTVSASLNHIKLSKSSILYAAETQLLIDPEHEVSGATGGAGLSLIPIVLNAKLERTMVTPTSCS